MKKMLPFWCESVLFFLVIQSQSVPALAKYIERDKVYKSGIWLPPVPQGEPMIEDIIVSAQGFSPWISDFRASTLYVVRDGPNPKFTIRLRGVYNLKTIQVLGPKDGKGLNTEFDVYTSRHYMNECMYPLTRHWKLCKSKLKFTHSYELLNITCDGNAEGVRHVMFTAGRPNTGQIVTGMHIAELFLYGDKIGEDVKTPEPKEEPIEFKNPIMELRQAVFGGVTSLTYEAKYTRFNWNPFSYDVPLCWKPIGIIALGATRGKGRIVAIMGYSWLDNMGPNSTLRANLRRHLGKRENASFVYANQDFKPGDVVVVRRSISFDVKKVKEAVLSGSNGLLVSFMGHIPERFEDDTAKLMEEFNISMGAHPYTWGTVTFNPEEFINSTAYMPIALHMELVQKSWALMRTIEIARDFNVLSSEDLKNVRDEKFQKQLRGLIDTYESYFSDRFPCYNHPITLDKKEMIAWWNFNQYMLLQFNDNAIPLHGTHSHPGLVGENERPVTHRVKITSEFGEDFIPTGVYANPGEKFTVRVLSHSHDLNRYRLTFGCFSDRLKQNQIVRYPRLWQSIEMQNETSYTPTVGGLLLVMMHGGGQSITLEFEGVYRHPWFDIRNKSSVDDWDNERRRYNGVPWMMYLGDVIRLCVQTQHVVKLNKADMIFSVSYLDNSVKLIHNFRGTKYENERMQVFACDVQISVGWGHSGYPIMGHLPWHEEFTKITWLKANSAIGMTHELGHNLQVRQITLLNGGEVTNNIYHFPIRSHLLNLTAYGYNVFRGLNDNEIRRIHNLWRGTTYVGVVDSYYNYMGYLFGEGILSNLMANALAQGGRLNTEEKKASFWLLQMCNETQYNVLPWQELWHFPINEETKKFCGNFKCFFPDDRVTKPVPDIVNRQITKYGGNCDRTVKKQVMVKRDLHRGFWSNRKPIITLL